MVASLGWMLVDCCSRLILVDADFSVNVSGC